MATIVVPDITLKPATVGSKGARALQRLDLYDQRKARILQTLKQMGLDEPDSRHSSAKSSRPNSAGSVRRSSEPNPTPGDGSKFNVRKVNNERRRSLMIESLGPVLGKPGGIGGTGGGVVNRRDISVVRGSRLAVVQDEEEEYEESDDITDNNPAQNANNVLFPGTPFRDLRSGRRRSLNIAASRPSHRISLPRVSLESDLLNPSEESDRQLAVSRRRSRRGSRTPNPRGRLLSTGTDSTGQMDHVMKQREQVTLSIDNLMINVDNILKTVL